MTVYVDSIVGRDRRHFWVFNGTMLNLKVEGGISYDVQNRSLRGANDVPDELEGWIDMSLVIQRGSEESMNRED